ncbi:MAG: M15 family metallopeptidase [Bacillota bacterium]
MRYARRCAQVCVIVAAVLLFMLAFARSIDRGFLRLAVSGSSSAAYLLTADDAPFRQLDLRGVQAALGQGSTFYLGSKETQFMVLNGRAFVQDPGQPETGISVSANLLNVRSFAGLSRRAAPTAVYYLPPGMPVSIDSMYCGIEGSCRSTFAILGYAEMIGDYTAPWHRRMLEAMWFPRHKLGTTPVILFGIHRPAGVNGHSSPPLRRTQGLVLAAGENAGVTVDPERLMQELTVASAKARAVKPVANAARVVSATLLVYKITDLERFDQVVDPPLADVTEIDPTIAVELRYATHNNVAGKAIYPKDAKPYLVADVAMRLKEVNAALKKKGYRLKVYDAYRPLSAHRQLYSRVRDSIYLADPWAGSYHCRGAAVDCTLITLDGRDVEMPTGFDEFSPRAARSYQYISPAARRHREVLEEAMRAEGFVPLPLEWWHFDAPGANLYPPLDIPL